jgi:hypothetical protein
MTTRRLALTALVLVLTLAGCAADERPALGPTPSGVREDPYFLKPGFMGEFDNRVRYQR